MTGAWRTTAAALVLRLWAGRALQQALSRHEKALDRLDRALREAVER